MKKIPTIFLRNLGDTTGELENRHLVRSEPNMAAAWVFHGEGVATRKYDGTACLVRGGRLWKRLTVSARNPAPFGFLAVDTDQHTLKTVGWIPVDERDPGDRWHRDALPPDGTVAVTGLPDRTYELVGPKVNGNPESLTTHFFVAHAAAEIFDDVPTDFARLSFWLADRDIEGIVWHHPDGRMAKIKLRDFGLRRPRPAVPSKVL